MRAYVRFAVPLLIALHIAPAPAWERFIGGAPSFVQNLAPAGALSADADGNVCLLTNDREWATQAFAHVLLLTAPNGDVQPQQLVGNQQSLTTLGVDCRFGPPALVYSGPDNAGSPRRTVLQTYRTDGSGDAEPPFDLPWLGGASPARFGVTADHSAVVLRQRGSGSAWDLQAFQLPMWGPKWQAAFDNWRFPAGIVRDMLVAADGSTSLLGTFERSPDPFTSVFLLHYDSAGVVLRWTEFQDWQYSEIGPLALAPAGTAYVVLRDSQFMRDQLWRIDAQQPMQQPIDIGCCGMTQITQLVALADDGALVAMRNAYGNSGELQRYGADGLLRWRADAYELAMPAGFDVLGVIGDRAGRALTVVTEPTFGGPPSVLRSVRLQAYSEQGVPTWSRQITGVRLDAGNPLRFAVTSDDRVVLALNRYDETLGGVSGILVQSFPLDSATP